MTDSTVVMVMISEEQLRQMGWVLAAIVGMLMVVTFKVILERP